jgi:protein TonB
MQRLLARGAIAGKLAVVVALGAGALWSAPFSSRAPTADEPGVAPVPVAQHEAATIPAPDTATEPPPPSEQAGDPFAGVDVGRDAVLRHIAGIVEPRRAAEARPKPVLARAPTSRRETTVAERLRTPPPPVQSAPVPAAPEPSAPALVTRASDPALVAPPPVAPALPDAAAKQAAEAGERGSATTPAAIAAPAADMNRVAMARVDAAPAPPPTVVPPRAIRRAVPVFPGEAIKAGIKTGRVLARVTIDADGRVTESQILSARPPGYFERESQRALTSWRYEPSGRSTSADVELLFARD